MVIQRNRSLDYVKDCLTGPNSLDKIIEMVQHFPPVPCYAGR